MLRFLLLLVIAIVVGIVGTRLTHETDPVITHEQTATATSWQDVVDYARQTLPTQGKLVVKSDGFVYLKVDDAYIHTLFPMLGLAEKGYREPPYFRTHDAPGAHISIFYADEQVNPDEEGQVFHFELKDIKIVHPSKTESYAILQVNAPELERLRKKYGFKSKIRGHEYHISIAKKTTHAN